MRYSNQFDLLQLIAEFKEIPGSDGYVINQFGHIFHKETKKREHISRSIREKDYVILIINGVPEKFLIRHLVNKLFGLRYNREDKDLDKVLMAINRHLNKVK